MITCKCFAPDIALKTSVRAVWAARRIPAGRALPIIVSRLGARLWAHANMIVGPCLPPNVAREASRGARGLGCSFELFEILPIPDSSSQNPKFDIMKTRTNTDPKVKGFILVRSIGAPLSIDA